jgi:hypothetical protein
MPQPDYFVANGPQHYRSGVWREIHAQVWAAHRDEWVHAPFWKRLFLRWQIEREVDAQYRQMAHDRDPYLLW